MRSAHDVVCCQAQAWENESLQSYSNTVVKQFSHALMFPKLDSSDTQQSYLISVSSQFTASVT